ncbi:tetratricopeptide repeat protein [Lusitaniella coriacea]|uniref:CHAT domain-containing protein n=1 Tax=Lusitaniella coriacea TaxID=1983105 RepID=UPI003CF678EA
MQTGIQQLRRSDFRFALATYWQALEKYRAIKDHAGQGEALYRIGMTHRYLSQYQQGLEMLERAFEVAKSIEDRELTGRILSEKCIIYYNLSQYDRALNFCEQALGIHREINDSAAEIETLGHFGVIYNAQGQYAKALEFQQQALEISQGTEDKYFQSRIFLNLSTIHFNLGEFDRAIELNEQAINTSQSFGNRFIEARSFNTIGAIYDNLGKLSEAGDYYQQALEIQNDIGDRSGAGSTLINIGSFHASQGKYQQALEFYQQALETFREIGERQGEGLTLNSIGNIYYHLGQYSQSLEFYQQSLAIQKEVGDRQGEGDTLNRIGAVYYVLGQYSQAIEIYQQSLAIQQEIGDRVGESYTLNSLGGTYYNLGESARALDYYQQSLALQQEIGNRQGEGNTINNIGLVYNRLGQFDRAIESFEQTLKLRREVGDRAGIGTTLNNLALAYENRGQSVSALRSYQQALGIFQDIGDRAGERIVYGNIGSLLERQNQPESAIVFYKQAVNVTELIRQDLRILPREQQDSYTETVAETYRRLANLLLEQGRILEAQQVLELLKVEELRDFTRNANAGGQTSGIALTPNEEEILAKHGTLIAFGQKVTECEETACNELDELLDKQTLIAQEFNQIIARLETEVRARRSQDTAFFDPEDLGRKAQEIVEAEPGTVLIYPFVLEDKIWLLWAAQGGIVKTVEVPVTQKELAQTVLRFRQQLQNPHSSTKRLQATSQKLYNWLIEPIKAELKANNITNLVFSLDRATRYIPMSALYDGEQYLIENYTVSTILSADLTDTRDRLPAGVENVSILAMGLSNAVEGFNPLPNVLDEIDAVVRTDANDSQGVYPGFAYLNDAFDFPTLRNNLRGNQILHLATHGDFKPGRPEESYLVLGTGEKLAIPEISTLRYLNSVHLVVLSACETALGGEGTDGVEINGISYYFLNQGAKAVMASLWLVNDASTAQLMQDFYGNLAGEQPVAKAEALRQAQLKMLRDEKLSEEDEDRGIVAVRPVGEVSETEVNAFGFSHPYYWAAFILIGNGF